MGHEDLTLKEAAKFNGLSAPFDQWIRRLSVKTQQEFIDCVEAEVDSIIKMVESNAAVREEDGEDRLTIDFIDQLTARGYSASKDSDYNGHSDVVVRWKDDEFVWLAEAKLHSDYDHLWEGFLQLTTRYSTGTHNCNRGGMLVYIRVNNAVSVVNKWQKHLEANHLKDGTAITCSPCVSKNPLRFMSENIHKKSGLPYHVRHFGVVLSVSPEDKSARQAKKHQVKK